MIVDTNEHKNFVSWLPVTSCESVVLFTIPYMCQKRTDVLQGYLTKKSCATEIGQTYIRKPIYYLLREWVIASLSRLLLGRIASPNKFARTKFVQEARDEVDDLAKMDEMVFVKIHSLNFGPISDPTSWTRETQRIQVDHLLILWTVGAPVMHMLSPYVVLVELLAPGNHV